VGYTVTADGSFKLGKWNNLTNDGCTGTDDGKLVGLFKNNITKLTLNGRDLTFKDSAGKTILTLKQG
jgi:hypothetical protein